MSDNKKTYLLAGDSFQLSFVLKSGRNKKLLVFDDSDKNVKNHKLRAIRYCHNESSIFLDEQSNHAIVTPIIFENQVLDVENTNLSLIKFLSVHPDNTANGGALFSLLDPEAEAEQDINLEELIIDIKNAVKMKEKEKDGIYELEALAAVLVGSVHRVKGMGASGLKREIYNKIDEDPYRFIDDKGNVTIFDDSDITRKYITLKAINAGVIIVTDDNKSVAWANKQVIVSVPRGITPVDHFAEFLSTDEGLIIMDEIQKRF